MLPVPLIPGQWWVAPELAFDEVVDVPVELLVVACDVVDGVVAVLWVDPAALARVAPPAAIAPVTVNASISRAILPCTGTSFGSWCFQTGQSTSEAHRSCVSAASEAQNTGTSR